MEPEKPIQMGRRTETSLPNAGLQSPALPEFKSGNSIQDTSSSRVQIRGP